MESNSMRNLWNNRQLILHLSILDLKMKYRESYLSFLWIGLEPLFMFVILYVVFTNIREPREEHFAIYLISGVIIYHLFSKGTITGLTSLRNNNGILKSLSINKNIFPMIAVVTTAILLIAELSILFAMMPFTGFVPSLTIVLFPLVLILLLALILGLSYFLSILYVKFPDIQPIWVVIVYALLFVSPIFWSLEQANDLLYSIQQINPLGQIIELFHGIIFDKIPTIQNWVHTGGIILAILISGYFFFKKYESKVVESL